MGIITLLVGTKKGGFLVESKDDRRTWRVSYPILLGNSIYHMVADPRLPNFIMMSVKTGHLGPTIFRSFDRGLSWEEASIPPAFPKRTSSISQKSVKFVFWLTPGHHSESGTWWAGTCPQGLFFSSNNGETWESFEGFNAYPEAQKWMDNEGTPIGTLLHSINIDPRNAEHMSIALSLGGIFETLDRGKSWKPLNQGVRADFLPNPYPEYGHCVHNFQMHPIDPDIWYQQNHCGVYRLDRKLGIWDHIGEQIPKEIGDIGFPLLLHPTDPQKIWVFPMDGSDVWPRTSVNGQPTLYHTRDGGKSWIRQDSGFPSENAWFTVKRQAMTHDFNSKLGLYVGTQQGEIWASFNEGAHWQPIVRYLPEIYSLDVMRG